MTWVVNRLLARYGQSMAFKRRPDLGGLKIKHLSNYPRKQGYHCRLRAIQNRVKLEDATWHPTGGPANRSTTRVTPALRPPHGRRERKATNDAPTATFHRAPWPPPQQRPQPEASSASLLLTRQHHPPLFLSSAPPTGGTRGGSLVFSRCSRRRRWRLGKRRTRSQRRRCWRPSSACRAVAVQ
jgi:hypothetical protein